MNADERKEMLRQLRFCLDSGARLVAKSGIAAGWIIYFLEAVDSELPVEERRYTFSAVLQSLQRRVIENMW